MKCSKSRPKFREIVTSFPAFNVYSRIARHTTALGPVCVATAVNQMSEWEVEVIDENNYRKPGPQDLNGLPDHQILQSLRHADYVGLYGGLSSTIPRLYDLARFYKSIGVTTIAGGQHFVDENIQDALENGVDYIIIGEGEYSLCELLTALCESRNLEQVDGIAYMQDGQLVKTAPRALITDFDSLPMPDFDLLRYAKIKMYPVSWVRGCGMNCEFCTVKGKPREMSVEHFFKQFGLLVEKYNATGFFIVDDLFGSRREDCLRLCGLLAKYQNATGIKLDITVQIRLDRGKDSELLQAMRAGGITMVCIGYESPIPEELTAMDKRIKVEEMTAMTRLYHKAGFLVHGMFIFGYPLTEGVNLEMSVDQRVRCFRSFIKKARIDTIQVLLPVPLPGTELTKRLRDSNRILPREDIGWEYYDGNFPLIKPDDPLTPEEMHYAIRKIMGRFYQFRSIFSIAGNVLIFPGMLFSLWNIKFYWRIWYRLWRNQIIRFGGWIVVRNWNSNLKKSQFSEKLAKGRKSLDDNPLDTSPPSD